MKRAMAVLLLCLCLSACAAPAEPGGILGQASGLDEDETLLTVDGREVPSWRYLYWLAYTCDRVAERYRDAGAVLDWQAPLDGGTLADYAKDQALADTALYATVENWAERYGCQLSEQERQAAGDDWDQRAGERGYLEKLADLGLDRERAVELNEVGALYAKLCALAEQPDSALAPAKEALDAFAAEDGRITVDRILVAAGEDRDAARERAAEAFAKLNGAEDQEEVFNTLAKAGDDKSGPRNILPGDGQLSRELEEAAQTLEVGQCSGILESDEGFSILRRLAPETAGLAEDYFDSCLQEAAAGAKTSLSEAYEQLDAASFYRKLETLREKKAKE